MREERRVEGRQGEREIAGLGGPSEPEWDAKRGGERNGQRDTGKALSCVNMDRVNTY